MASNKKNLGEMLSMAAMAFGQGMTGQPYLTNYQNLETKRQELEAEQQFKTWQKNLEEKKLATERQKLIMEQKYKNALLRNGVPVYSFGADGALVQMGSVPRGAKVVPPGSSETPEQKTAREIQTQKQKDVEAQNVKREIYSQDLATFLQVDDVLQQARGQGLGRLGAGGKMTWEGFKQDTPLGQAVASHESARKRLRVQLVRAAGDVGNINIVEQKAAEMMIPTQWDAAPTATLKRAYLQQIGQAINSNDGNAVKDVLSRFMRTPIWKAGLVSIKHNGKTYNIPEDEVADFKKEKGIK